MFERFTERARQVVILAQDEVRALEHDCIGSEHILLGLVRADDGVAELRAERERLHGPAEPPEQP